MRHQHILQQKKTAVPLAVFLLFFNSDALQLRTRHQDGNRGMHNSYPIKIGTSRPRQGLSYIRSSRNPRHRRNLYTFRNWLACSCSFLMYLYQFNKIC